MIYLQETITDTLSMDSPGECIMSACQQRLYAATFNLRRRPGNTHIHIHIRTHTHIHLHTCTHTRIHTHTHMHSSPSERAFEPGAPTASLPKDERENSIFVSALKEHFQKGSLNERIDVLLTDAAEGQLIWSKTGVVF